MRLHKDKYFADDQQIYCWFNVFLVQLQKQNNCENRTIVKMHHWKYCQMCYTLNCTSQAWFRPQKPTHLSLSSSLLPLLPFFFSICVLVISVYVYICALVSSPLISSLSIFHSSCLFSFSLVSSPFFWSAFYWSPLLRSSCLISPHLVCSPLISSPLVSEAHSYKIGYHRIFAR